MEINLSNYKVQILETLETIQVSIYTKEGMLLHSYLVTKEQLVEEQAKILSSL